MSEIGVIGAIYEDRRTKKKGKLVERDEKYKTLLMEASDGKSFNITFGGFKSNWRKVDEPEQTVEEAMQEIPIPEKKKPEKSKKKPEVKRKATETEVSDGLESTITTLADFVNSFEGIKIKLNTVMKKRSNAILINGKRLFEVVYGVRDNVYTVCVGEKLAVELKKKSYAKDMMYHEKWLLLKYAFRLDVEDLDTFLDDMRDAIVKIIDTEEE